MREVTNGSSNRAQDLPSSVPCCRNSPTKVMRLRSAAVRVIERPPRGPAGLKLDRVVIGWNESIESTHAIHRALPFMQDATDVLLINGEKPDHEDASDTAAPRFDPLDYLKRHRVAVSSRRLHALPQQVGAAQLRDATAFHADLLVMGHLPTHACASESWAVPRGTCWSTRQCQC